MNAADTSQLARAITEQVKAEFSKPFESAARAGRMIYPIVGLIFGLGGWVTWMQNSINDLQNNKIAVQAHLADFDKSIAARDKELNAKVDSIRVDVTRMGTNIEWLRMNQEQK